MSNILLRVFLILMVAICMSATTVLAVGVPDPSISTVEDPLLTCPAGDIGFTVTVLDDTGTPCSGALVEINFCDCQEAMLCLYGGGTPCGNGKNDRLLATTDVNGVAILFPAAGGICDGATVDILADGVLLATRIVLALDYSGNFIVELDDYTNDPVWSDYDGNEILDLNDLAIFNMHVFHSCDGPVSSENQTWGGIKTLWR